MGNIIIATLFFLAGCSSQPEFTLDYDASYNFAGLETYRWYDDVYPSQLADYRQYNASDKRVRFFVDRELQKKSFKEVATGKADFLINYHIAKEERVKIDNFARYPSAGMHGGVGVGTYGTAVSVGYSSGPSVKTYKEGTVVLDVIDSASGNVVWRNIVEGRLPKSLSSNEKDAMAAKLSKEMMLDFPPG
ncbi:DUF4136 domain-containing protein [Luminiphilus syltensis]|uniref:DUF4136 domain-containing protein n=1 Tax=Luminiphilus syltensis TaxID=1341119 RepID=UPI0018A7ED26|nr:DUF4136 domain-containing protein [Luminiphilus syltensis]